MRRLRPLALLVAAGVAAAAPLTAQEPPPPPTSSAPAPAPAPKPFEDIIKLWKANLSEDFIRKQIESGSTIYTLSADDIIKCRDSGLPESLINVMIDTTRRKPAGEPAPPPPAAPTSGTVVSTMPSSPPAITPPLPNYAADANRKWEGLARRNSGVVIFKSRWDVGTLEFKEETFRWVDAKDAGKNLLIPARQVTEQFLTCLKKAGGNECFEWGVKTKDESYRFRDVSWEQGDNKKVQEIFDFLKAIYPNLVSSNVPVDSK